MPMSDGWKNLIPVNKRTKAEQKVITTAGGKASGVARVRKKNFQEMMKYLLELETTDELTGELKQMRQILCDAQIEKAKHGDTRAFESIVAVAGEKPAEKHEVTGADGQPIVRYITPDELAETEKHINNMIGDDR